MKYHLRPPSDFVLHPAGDILGVVVLPASDHPPASCFQLLVSPAVAFAIGCELGSPVVDV